VLVEVVDVVVLVVVVELVVVDVVVAGTVVVVVAGTVVVVVAGTVVVVVVPGTLAGSAGFEPASSSVRSGKPSSSRSMPSRLPRPLGPVRCLISSPDGFACELSWL